MRQARFAIVVALVLTGFLLEALGPAAAQTPKSGGTLNVMQREDLSQGFAIHETSTISVVWPARSAGSLGRPTRSR